MALGYLSINTYLFAVSKNITKCCTVQYLSLGRIPDGHFNYAARDVGCCGVGFHLKRKKTRLIEGNAKFRHLQKLTCKWTFCGKCLSEFVD